MRLEEKEVKHLAALARLELSEEELKKYTSQLSEVLDYVNKLQALPTNELNKSVSAGVSLRSDKVDPWPDSGELIDLAPTKEKNMIYKKRMQILSIKSLFPLQKSIFDLEGILR